MYTHARIGKAGGEEGGGRREEGGGGRGGLREGGLRDPPDFTEK